MEGSLSYTSLKVFLIKFWLLFENIVRNLFHVKDLDLISVLYFLSTENVSEPTVCEFVENRDLPRRQWFICFVKMSSSSFMFRY